MASLIEESGALERSGEIATSCQMALQALSLPREGGEPSALAAALVNLVRVRFRLGQYETAQALAQEAADIVAPDSSEHVEALLSLGACAVVGSLSEAESCLQRAANLVRELGQHVLRFRALHNLAAVPTPIVLILDDYQAIGQPDIHQIVTFLLDHCPPQMHLAIASREDPPMPLSQLRARRQITEIRERDLRFTT